ncbi:DEKNAAC100932 [Brettanomyces naardenensis]|uniref:Phosphatidylinositol 3-kinase VPS34 n=1 Tax=Brettanomyces naardenensis TaxID=13370 RepID=A0A448YGQ0_BRENA|nr:DEKNAAC100932 [Brettanomyces naardenensis]
MSNAEEQNLVNFCLSKDLNLPVRFKLVNVSGLTKRLVENIYREDDKNGEAHNEATSRIIRAKLYEEERQHQSLIVTVFIESGVGKKLTSPIVTSINYAIDSSGRVSNGSSSSPWINLPIDYSKLTLDSRMVLKYYNFDLRTGDRLLVGHSSIDMFDRDNSCTLVKGHQKVEVSLLGSKEEEGRAKSKEESASLTRPVDWLNKLAARRMEQIRLDEAARIRGRNNDTDDRSVYVDIEFVQFELPIVFSDAKYASLKIPTSVAHNGSATVKNGNHLEDTTAITTTAAAAADFNQITYDNSQEFSSKPSSTVFDPDLYRAEVSEDPIEYKFRKLERTHQLSSLDKDIKPTLKVRVKLDSILKKQFFEKLTQQEKNLMWNFRFFLLNGLVVNGNNEQYNNFIINFIKSINWDEDFEVREFLAILKDLDTKSGIGSKGSNLFIQELTIVDCLELLSENYRNKIVRDMAIQRLQLATDDELEMFMIQLVRSIANEPGADDNEASEVGNGGEVDDYQVIESGSEDMVMKYLYSSDLLLKPGMRFSSPLSDFIIARAVQNSSLTNFLYWNLKVQVDEERARNRAILQNQPIANGVVTVVSNENNEDDETRTQNPQRLKEVHERGRQSHVYERTLLTLITKLSSSRDVSHLRIRMIRRQVALVKQIHDIAMKIKVDYRREPTPKKIEILQQLLSEKHKKSALGEADIADSREEESRSSSSNTTLALTSTRESVGSSSSSSRYRRRAFSITEHESLLRFPGIPFPLNPRVNVTGTFPEDCSVFKSSLSPLKIAFKTDRSGEYSVMYKVGDDLRQDQFIIQIIALMDKILQSENLDLRLTPYKILATGPAEGLIQFVPNGSLSSILSVYNNSIMSYLKEHNPDPSAPHQVKAEVMDTYVRSCAGYCVITYILGVGDRHLENLLLTTDGYFFHADFGYILGADPKPFPPLMKLPIQVIEGMGGLNDDNYQKFCNYCFITYLTLRRNASTILNLFQLMINTSIPALQTIDENNESEKLELIWKVQEKFMLDMNDEEAVLHFQRLIDGSVNALYPVVIDRLHSMAQYWRS